MAKSSVDPLDVITGVVATLLGGTAYATYKGHGIPAVATLTALTGAAYFTAPRRTFPKASDVVSETDVAGKVALVTGATSGIGIDTAGALYQKGAKVYMAARNPQKLEQAKEVILQKYNSDKAGQLVTLICDLNDLESVQKCAEAFLKAEPKLHILINNAGIMALPERHSTKQGLEQQVGVCHVGHFMLTTKLLPAMKAVKTASKKGEEESPARVVCLSSSGHRRQEMKQLLENGNIDKKTLLETVPYKPWVAYGNAKCSNLLFACELAKRHGTDNILAYSVMPGGIHTGLQTHVDWWTMLKWTLVTPFFFKSTSQGAATSLVCATTADPNYSGQYYDNCQPTTAVAMVEEEVGADAAAKLWTRTEEVLKALGF